MQRDSERRLAFRHRLSMPVRVRNRSGLRTTAMVTDLNDEGCALWFRSSPGDLGKEIAIQPEGMEGWWGQVIWRHEERCGVRFEHQLYGPVVEHLIKQFPPF